MGYRKFQIIRWVSLLPLALGCSGQLGHPDGLGAPPGEESPRKPTVGRDGDVDGGVNGAADDGLGSPDGPGANSGANGASSGVVPGGGSSGTASGSAPFQPAPGTSGANPDPDTPPVQCDTGALSLGSAPLRRLSSNEYLLTLSDLFAGQAPELPPLPIEDPVDSFDNDARALGPSDVHVSRWEEIAFRYTSELIADPAALATLLPCAQNVEDENTARQCGAEWIDSLGLKTHRRPLSAEESERYQTVFDQHLAEIDFEAAVQLTALAMLQAPAFLYRLEVPREALQGESVQLDSWEMASRLSYFLWQRMPDEALFEAAHNDALQTDAEIRQQVQRMLADPRARQAVADFHRQWLFFDRIYRDEHASRLAELFPDWTSSTQTAAHQELLRFVEKSVFDGAGTFSDLLLSTQSEVNPELADIYGVELQSRDGQWESVTLPESERAGVLTRIGFLAAHAHSANGSPPLRGAYVMQRLFCMTPQPPPPGADTSPPEASGQALTNRELFAERTAPRDCQGCHTILDSFGFGFENYDAVGAYRSQDNGKPVNARVTPMGTDIRTEVDGAVELSAQIAQSKQAADCLVTRWTRYARGRALEAADQCALDDLKAKFDASGGNIVNLLVELTLSPEFRNRPVEPTL